MKVKIELKKDYSDNVVSGDKNPTISLIDVEKNQVLCTFSVVRNTERKSTNEGPFKLDVSYDSGLVIIPNSD